MDEKYTYRNINEYYSFLFNKSEYSMNLYSHINNSIVLDEDAYNIKVKNFSIDNINTIFIVNNSYIFIPNLNISYRIGNVLHYNKYYMIVKRHNGYFLINYEPYTIEFFMFIRNYHFYSIFYMLSYDYSCYLCSNSKAIKIKLINNIDI